MCFGPDSEPITVTLAVGQPTNRINEPLENGRGFKSGIQGTLTMTFQQGGRTITASDGWRFSESVEVIRGSGPMATTRDSVPLTTNTELIDDIGPFAITPVAHPESVVQSQLIDGLNHRGQPWDRETRQTLKIIVPGGSTPRSFTNTRVVTNLNPDGTRRRVDDARGNNFMLRVTVP
jgi:hypothetical protein